MSNIVEYRNLVAFHPGYYVAEAIEDMGISEADFATRLGTIPDIVSLLINGQINLSDEFVQKIATMMGTSAEMWLNLQSTFDQKIIEIEKAKVSDNKIG